MVGQSVNLQATDYKALGIDPTQSFEDHTGQRIPVLDEGKAIEEAF